MTIQLPDWWKSVLALLIASGILLLDHFTGWDMDSEAVALIATVLGIPQLASVLTAALTSSNGEDDG